MVLRLEIADRQVDRLRRNARRTYQDRYALREMKDAYLRLIDELGARLFEVAQSRGHRHSRDLPGDRPKADAQFPAEDGRLYVRYRSGRKTA